MIRRDKEIRVRRNIRATFVMCTKELIVEKTLQKITGLIARRAYE